MGVGLGAKTPPKITGRTWSRKSHAIPGPRVGMDVCQWLYLHLLECGMAQAPVPAPVTLGESRLRDTAVRSPAVRFVAWKELGTGWLGGFGDPAPSERPRVGPREKVLSRPAGGAIVCASGSGGGRWEGRGGARWNPGEEALGLDQRRGNGDGGPGFSMFSSNLPQVWGVGALDKFYCSSAPWPGSRHTLGPSSHP